MTTIAKDVASKFAVAFVAVAMIFTMFAPAANAQTQSVEDLQALIETLMAQINALEGTMGGSTTAPAGAPAVCPYTWTRDLSQGSTGADVMKLQQFLNSYPDLRVAATGAGSAGMETDYYGPATAAAVSKMQVMFRAEVLTPGGLVNPTGYFGSMSRAKANDLCVADAVVTPTPDATDEEEAEEEEEEETGSMTLSGEGTLEDVTIDDEEDELEEGDEDVAVAMVTVEAEDGDIEVARVTFAAIASAGTAEVDPWDVFGTFSLWVDGDMIAEMDASDEDEYLNEDAGTFRFSNLDLFVEEDEEVEMLLGVSVDEAEDASEFWNFGVIEIRYFDADGVATTEDQLGDLGDADITTDAEHAEFVEVEVREEGAGDELDITTASEDPDAATIAVEEDEDEEVMIFAFELDADDSDSDIEIEDLRIRIQGTAVDPDSTDLDEFVSDMFLEIDGERFNVEDFDGDNNDETVTFEIDGDIVIDEGEAVVAMLFVEFRVDDDFTSATIQASTVDVDAVGADDFTVADVVAGEEHQVVSEGIIVPQEGFTFDADTSGENDTLGNFDIEFDVTAFEGDFYIFDNATTADATAITEGIQFVVQDSAGNAVTTGVTAVLSTDGDEEENIGGDNFFFIEEGETDTITLSVVVDPGATGQFRVVLQEVWFDEDTDLGTNADPRVLTPASDYRTNFLTIQN